MSQFKEVNSSFNRCVETGLFAQTFYEKFLNKSPEVVQLFARTDFVKQQDLLQTTVKIMVEKRFEDHDLKRHLDVLSHTHNRHNYNIPSELYDLWLDSLCETVEQLDPNYSSSLREAWQKQMIPSINYIVEAY